MGMNVWEGVFATLTCLQDVFNKSCPIMLITVVILGCCFGDEHV